MIIITKKISKGKTTSAKISRNRVLITCKTTKKGNARSTTTILPEQALVSPTLRLHSEALLHTRKAILSNNSFNYPEILGTLPCNFSRISLKELKRTSAATESAMLLMHVKQVTNTSIVPLIFTHIISSALEEKRINMQPDDFTSLFD